MKMKTNIYKIAVFLLLFALLLPTLSGCAVRESDEELLAVAEEKLRKSVAVNEICFGDGLALMTEGGYTHLGYMQVTRESREQYGITTTEDIKRMVAEVYSEETCLYVDTLIFTTVNTDATTSYSRYMDEYNEVKGEHYLLAKMNYKQFARGVASYSNLRITSHKRNTAVLTVDITVTDGEQTREISGVELDLCYENGCWYFNELTYASIN
jgi:hypothetical protein